MVFSSFCCYKFNISMFSHIFPSISKDCIQRQNIRASTDDYVENKNVYLLQNLIKQIQTKEKKAFENQKPINPFLFVPGCKRKSIKVINTLLVK